MMPSLKSIKLGGKTGGQFLLEFEKCDVIYCVPAKKLKLVARAFDDRNKSLP